MKLENAPGRPPLGENPGQPPLTDVRHVKRKFLDIPYGNESPAQRFDLFLPDTGDGPFPLVIHIHGGGFAMGDKRDEFFGAYLTGIRQGFAVATIEYRLSGEAIFPAAVLDCRAAVRFIREHAAEYLVDGDRFAVLGGSAGGNLAAMIGMNIPNGAFPGEESLPLPATQPFVKAAVDQFGPMDFKAMDGQARQNGLSHADHDQPFSPESKYLGIAVPDAPQALCEQANPASYAGPFMAPFLVQHGTVDKLVPYEQSAGFVAALRAKGFGDRVTFLPLRGADHADKLFMTEENLTIIFDFIKNHLQG